MTAHISNHNQQGLLRAVISLLNLLKYVLKTLLALVLIILSSPLHLGVAILILAVDGRPVFHRGKRLGLNRRPFTMYKFRTLQRGVNTVIGAELLSYRHRLTIPCGKFLRDTRLDELPQLINILKGNMSFFGPRPVRPEVYENLCQHLEEYGRRFSVKPGLVGYSQLFTPHSAPKRLRMLADNRVLRHACSCYLFQEAFLVAYAVVAVSNVVVGRLLRYTWNDLLRSRILRFYREKRELTRVRPRNARVLIEGNNGQTIDVPLVDINEEAFLVECPEQLTETALPLKVKIEMRFRRRLKKSSTRTRIARCTAQVFQNEPAAGSWRYVIRYDPMTDWNRYLIHQYLLRGSLASPYRSLGNGNGAAGRFRYTVSPRASAAGQTLGGQIQNTS